MLPGHPLAAGLAGKVTVVSSPQRFAWGKPAAEAIKVASPVGRPDAFGIFAYEAGANMAGMRASAPRVGFFSEGNAPAAFTPQGLALFDAAVTWARAPRALLIVKQKPLRPDDEALRKRLEDSFGFAVDVRLGTEAIAAHASGHQVIVISESIGSSDVGNKFTSVAVPLVSFEPGLFDDLKMTGNTSNTDFGATNDQTEFELVKADHPLAAGLAAGRHAAVSGPSRFVWGSPGNAAVKVAHLVGKPNAWGIFGYEAGATMIGQTAPARRVGCFVGENTAALLNDRGKSLMDAAVLWASGRIEVRGAMPRLDEVMGTWRVGVAYTVGDEVRFQGLDYRCRQSHVSQSDREPPGVFALWERINAGSVWATQVIYRTGDEVTFEGNRYRCLQGHQAQIDWKPPAVPALWQRLT